ncbi:MAG: hypothetical protein J6X18_12300 [Bacteroidales bacterium]|nr:hypothetical protein [Bacteroidales bacterium]
MNYKRKINEGGLHYGQNVPKQIINDIEENFGNHSVTPMDSSWYVVGVDGKYGYYEIDVAANGHCRIKMYKHNNHNKEEDDQWYHTDREWFTWCEETPEEQLYEGQKRSRKQVIKLNETQLTKLVKESVKHVLKEMKTEYFK